MEMCDLEEENLQDLSKIVEERGDLITGGPIELLN